MTVYSFKYAIKNGNVLRTSWFPTEKEARIALRCFKEAACGEDGPFVCQQSTVDRHTVRCKSELLGMLNSLTHGYEVDQYA